MSSMLSRLVAREVFRECLDSRRVAVEDAEFVDSTEVLVEAASLLGVSTPRFLMLARGVACGEDRGERVDCPGPGLLVVISFQSEGFPEGPKPSGPCSTARRVE